MTRAAQRAGIWVFRRIAIGKVREPAGYKRASRHDFITFNTELLRPSEVERIDELVPVRNVMGSTGRAALYC